MTEPTDGITRGCILYAKIRNKLAAPLYLLPRRGFVSLSSVGWVRKMCQASFTNYVIWKAGKIYIRGAHAHRLQWLSCRLIIKHVYSWCMVFSFVHWIIIFFIIIIILTKVTLLTINCITLCVYLLVKSRCTIRVSWVK